MQQALLITLISVAFDTFIFWTHLMERPNGG
ncbi:hypothetical protein BHAOGJBA_5978 [Methylobacterium hispanicum]|uniref:Uncharacterized protein n=1 Tax=Methylobacterium hispanicum TaxID=270350 RepID=A0AAV4ZWE8_9HYPH|nr:hypothetical protein BHAOGJBA_5978 [Methylobacterium hispanicum]